MSQKIGYAFFCHAFFIFLGFILRFVLSCKTFGTNDVNTWYNFCEVASNLGITEVYIKYPNANHPPVSLWLMRALFRLANALDVPFYALFKGVVSFFDIITMVIVGFKGGILPLALYSFSPVALYTIGYHGNTDGIVVALSLLGMTLINHRRYPFIAGMLIGLCSSIKLIGALLLPFLWRYDSRCFFRGVIGALIPLSSLLFGIYLAPHQFVNQVVRYSPPFDYWGVPMLATMIAYEWRSLWSNFPKELVALYIPIAKISTILVSFFIGKGTGSSLNNSDWNDTLIIMGVFVILAPGFGMQYLLYPLPFLCCLLPKKALIYNIFGGVAALVLVIHFYRPMNGIPASFHNSTSPPLAIFFLFLTWVVIVDSLFSVLYKNKRLANKFIH